MYRKDEEPQCTQSKDDSAQMMIPSLALVATHQDPGMLEVPKAEPYFPPGFTELMNGCRPEVSEGCFPSSLTSFDASLINYLNAATQAGSGDLKNQFVVNPLPPFRQNNYPFLYNLCPLILAHSLPCSNILKELLLKVDILFHYNILIDLILHTY